MSCRKPLLFQELFQEYREPAAPGQCFPKQKPDPGPDSVPEEIPKPQHCRRLPGGSRFGASRFSREPSLFLREAPSFREEHYLARDFSFRQISSFSRCKPNERLHTENPPASPLPCFRNPETKDSPESGSPHRFQDYEPAHPKQDRKDTKPPCGTDYPPAVPVPGPHHPPNQIPEEIFLTRNPESRFRNSGSVPKKSPEILFCPLASLLLFRLPGFLLPKFPKQPGKKHPAPCRNRIPTGCTICMRRWRLWRHRKPRSIRL